MANPHQSKLLEYYPISAYDTYSRATPECSAAEDISRLSGLGSCFVIRVEKEKDK
jgi:hypothetical protein